MIMPPNTAYVLQRRLQYYDDTGGTCAGMIQYTADIDSSYLMSDWQDAVDNIYRCLQAGLLIVVNDDFFTEYTSLVEALRRISPFEDDEKRIVWMGTFLDPTKKLLDLVAGYLATTGFQKDAVNKEFIEDIERLFAESGVSWSPDPLVPLIAPAN